MRYAYSSVLVSASLLCACGAPRLPHPRYVSHPTEALEEVAFPPPPPLVEHVPPSPADGAVWVDGEWRFSSRRWRWRRGRWLLPPSNLAFSPSVEVRGTDGTMYYAPGIWRNEKGEAVEDPPQLSVARGQSITSVVNASGETEDVGRSGRGGRGRGP